MDCPLQRTVEFRQLSSCRRSPDLRSRWSTIDPLDLQAAQEQDAGALSEYTHLASVPSNTRETFIMKRWDEDKPSGHSFITGSVVRLSRRYPARKAALGPYHVVAQLLRGMDNRNTASKAAVNPSIVPLQKMS